MIVPFLKKITYSLINSFNDIAAPEICVVCNENLTGSRELKYICSQCLDKISIADEPDILVNALAETFGSDSLALNKIYSLIALKENEKYMNPVYLMKYSGLHDIGKEFGRLLGKLIKSYNAVKYDYIIPVPIHKVRNRERGYNQSDYIAEGLSEKLDIPILNKAIIRIKNTGTQTALDSENRIKNVKNAFEVKNDMVNLIKGGKLLICDDVLTTGSTLNSCAYTLLSAGAILTEGATIVRA